MKGYNHFHLVYSLKFIQKTLIVCLVPLIRALLDFDLASLYTAFLQQLALLAVLAGISFVVWLRGGWKLEPGGLTLRYGVLLIRSRTLTPAQIAVVELRRTVPLRLLGATRVTVYLAKGASLPKAHFFLPKEDAALLAEQLMPVKEATSFYQPTGAQRLSLTMLSANLMTTAVLTWFAVRQTAETFGQILPDNWQQLNAVTLRNLATLEHIISRIVPTGVAWLFTLMLVLSCLSLVGSSLRTARFEVARHGGVIVCGGGLLTLTQRRVRASAVTVCDVRSTLAARLLRRYPVYLFAGSYNGGDIPVLVYKRGQEDLLEALMPEFRIPRPTRRPSRTQNRSKAAFMALPGILLGFTFVLLLVSLWRLPVMTPVLTLLCLVFLVYLLVQAQGYFIEDAWRSELDVLTARYVRGFTLHTVCVFTDDVSFGTRQTPFSEMRGRCTLRMRMPFHRLVRVRSLEQFRAMNLPLDV